MKAVICKFRNNYEFEFTETDIDQDPQLKNSFNDKIPVLFINGRIFAKYRIDESKLGAKLKILQT